MGSIGVKQGGGLGGAVAPPTGVQTQVPTQQNTPVNASALEQLSNMSEVDLVSLLNEADDAQLPNYLADVQNLTQQFVYLAGLNEKPLVLDSTEFNQFLADNNISSNSVLYRMVSPITYTNQDNTRITLTAENIADMLKYSRFNYIGGKHGGNAMGDGTYFNTGWPAGGYGTFRIRGALNPKTARVIEYRDISNRFQSDTGAFADRLRQRTTSYGKSYISYQTALTMYALSKGYNVITDDDMRKNLKGTYVNVIDRSALVLEA